MCGCLSCAPCWGPGPQPRYMPWNSTSDLWFAGRHSIHRATPARAQLNYFFSQDEGNYKLYVSQNVHGSPGWVAQLVGASSYTPEVCGFDPWSRHIPRLWVQSPVKVHTGGNQLMFLSLPSSLCKINKHVLGGGLKKCTRRCAWSSYHVKEDLKTSWQGRVRPELRRAPG